MTYTHKIIASIVALGMFAFAVLTVGAQTAMAQEVFDGPDDRPAGVQARPTKFRSLQQIKRDVKQDGLTDFRERSKELREDLKDKRDAFRDQARNKREDLKTSGKTLRDGIKAEADARRAQIKAELDAAQTPEERQAILKAARIERDTMRTDALQKRDAFRDRAKDLRTELREHRDEFRAQAKTEMGNRMKAHLEGILKRVANTLEKFTDLLNRMNNKLAELEANGVDTAEAVAAATTTEQAIQDASSELATARAAFVEAIESDTPREHLDRLKAAVRSAGKAVKEAHRALRDALKELKEITSAINDSDSDEDDSDDDSDSGDDA